MKRNRSDHPRLRRLLRAPGGPEAARDPQILVLELALGRLSGGHNEDYLAAVLAGLDDRAPVVWAPDRDGWGRPPGWARRAQDIALAWLAMHPPKGHRRILITQNPSAWELLTLRAVTLLSRRRRGVAVFVLRRSGMTGSRFLERLSSLADRSVRSLVRSRRLWPASDSSLVLNELREATGVQGTLLPIPVRRSALAAGPRTGPPVVSLVGAFRREKGAAHYRAVVEAALEHDPTVEVDVQLGGGSAADDSAALAAELQEAWAGEPRVRAHGTFLAADEYDAILARSDIVVTPYEVEVYGTGTSGVINEALAAGAVVLTTPIAWAVSEYDEHPRVRFLPATDRRTIARELGEAIDLGLRARA
ncbi:MAG: glycosyltransferase, partial [Actinomycetota bacterium]|nr:glycosyltransferase [Actinomycetota bacterium]